MRPVRLEAAAPADLDGAASFLQTSWWAAFKSRHGWQSLAFGVRSEDGATHPLSVLLRRLPLGLTLAYIPHPPPWDETALAALSGLLRPLLPAGTVCLRWDLQSGTQAGPDHGGGDEVPSGSPDPRPAPLGAPFRKPPADVQPPDTVIVALDGDETLLARMHKKTRYNLRLAEKKGVTVERGGPQDLDTWYGLYRQTAERDRISIHSQDYYRDLMETAPGLTLWLARYEGQVLAGNLVLRHRTLATYLYGASSNEHRNLMAPALLQWVAMRAARDDGALFYDLFGIPPSDDPAHPMHGLYRFKTGFGGVRHHRHGAWDWVVRPGAWTLWTAADRARVWYFKVWKKR